MILGKVIPDAAGKILGTGFDRFVSPIGIEGLAKDNGAGQLDLLAVINPTDERGLFRRFIAEAKLEYETICVWAIENPALYAALLRYGFLPEQTIDRFGVPLEGLRWDKPKP